MATTCEDNGIYTNDGMLSSKPCNVFAEMLSARTPTPGGGGATAMSAALAASLASMAARFMLGKKRYADIEGRVKATISDCDAIRERALKGICDDADAYELVSAAYRIDKGDSGRYHDIEVASIRACIPPMTVIADMMSLLPHLEFLVDNVGAMLISDVGCSASLCSSSIESSKMNVLINLRSVNRPYADLIADQVTDVTRQAKARCDGIIEQTISVLLS